ncbi:HNH endonuclease [Pontibacter ummariensis]|uniref:HNH endonuclease n=2 Tax=Pontibacter ummariensis TaxID=1610492 RepID=A0A239HJW0_9BACT|nr:HNH endonuclease [Pontibacter ummariensis]SNS81637.1 HNH endonuclease [Pontibacter ummariensis]
MRDCIICKESFAPKTVKHLTCSAKCSKANKLAKWYAKIGKATCVTCGVEFQPKSPVNPEQGKLNRYCSLKCRSNDPAFFEKRGHALRLIPARKGQNYSYVHFNKCRVCFNLFTAKYKAKALCSDECRKVEYAAYLESQRQSQRQYAESVYKPKEFNCKECGKAFTTVYGDKRKEYCSTRCSKKHLGRVAKGKRRARIRGQDYESVNPFKVFIRDKWKCRICGINTPKKLRGTIEPNAPELDHIIPVAQGGSHTYSNVQCACRACNSKKSDKVIGQLPLILPGGRGIQSSALFAHITVAPARKIGVSSA